MEGQALPYVPPVVSRLDVGARRGLGVAWGRALEWQAGLGVSHLSERPLPYGERSPRVLLVDASAGLAWVGEGGEGWRLSLEGFNLMGANYAANEMVFASDWHPSDGVRSRVPARHIAAGAPRAWGLQLEWRR